MSEPADGGELADGEEADGVWRDYAVALRSASHSS